MGLVKWRPSTLLTLESATYSWPESQQDGFRLTLENVCPWLLWIVTAHASLTGNWEYLPTTVRLNVVAIGSSAQFSPDTVKSSGNRFERDSSVPGDLRVGMTFVPEPQHIELLLGQ